MIEVCWAVDVEMSPMSASAPVLNTPIASPDRPSITAKNRNVSPAANRKQAAANSVRPTTIVRPPAKPIGELPEEETRQRDAGHRRVLERAGGGQRQTGTS